jgi:predicted nuclease of predicted toxin-antitoxin system
MAIAIAQQRTIITFDRDYGELIFRFLYKPNCGVIYLRFDEYSPKDPGVIIEDVILNSGIDFSNALTVIDKNGIRQRRY